MCSTRDTYLFLLLPQGCCGATLVLSSANTARQAPPLTTTRSWLLLQYISFQRPGCCAQPRPANGSGTQVVNAQCCTPESAQTKEYSTYITQFSHLLVSAAASGIACGATLVVSSASTARHAPSSSTATAADPKRIVTLLSARYSSSIHRASVRLHDWTETVEQPKFCRKGAITCSLIRSDNDNRI